MDSTLPLTDPKVVVLTLLAENELVLSQLYKRYAEIFPEKKVFWEQIAAEEVSHATILITLGEQAKKGEIYFDADRFNEETIHFSIEYKRQKMIESHLPLYTYLRAISTAYVLEQAFLECRFFEVFDGDSAGFKQQMEAIKISTLEHLKEIKEEWTETNRLQNSHNLP